MIVRATQPRIVRVVIGLFCFALAAVGCSSDDELTPEEQILAQFQIMESAAEERRIDDFVNYIAANYSDNKSLTRDKIERLLRIKFFAQQSVHVFSKVTRIDAHDSTDNDGQKANAVVYAGVARTPFDSLADLTDVAVDVVRFDLKLRHDADRWLVESSTWHRASLIDAL